MDKNNQSSSADLFRTKLQAEKPMQIAGTINAYSALMAEQSGFQSIYLSGAGVANACYGLPDLGITTLADVVEEVSRIHSVCKLPLLVDADTGWDDPAETALALARAGAAAMHLEDQVSLKRCGHRKGKQLVSIDEMTQRLSSARDGAQDIDIVLMARTDAYANEGLDASIERANAYLQAGAEMIFAEALPDIETFKQFSQVVNAPVLANMTEFGQSILYTPKAFRDAGVAMVLYPLSAFRAMNQAAMHVYQTIRETGSQQELLPRMQTREQLYDILDYEKYENDPHMIELLMNSHQQKKAKS